MAQQNQNPNQKQPGQQNQQDQQQGRRDQQQQQQQDQQRKERNQQQGGHDEEDGPRAVRGVTGEAPPRAGLRLFQHADTLQHRLGRHVVGVGAGLVLRNLHAHAVVQVHPVLGDLPGLRIAEVHRLQREHVLRAEGAFDEVRAVVAVLIQHV
ncbi:hypothetical protein G6F61_014438 [Rhizopus arrhizus]|nr:hypothetical protein G6F61_014438 [Rhizopus arrhizus]